MHAGFHAVSRSSLRLGDRVVVQGAGPVGLLTVQLAKAAGVGSVTVIEPDAARWQWPWTWERISFPSTVTQRTPPCRTPSAASVPTSFPRAMGRVADQRGDVFRLDTATVGLSGLAGVVKDIASGRSTQQQVLTDPRLSA